MKSTVTFQEVKRCAMRLPFLSGASRRARHGFSLVEVTLAMGIVSFAFVTIFGLLPVGLDVSRQAIDTTVCSQITQQMIHAAQQTDFSRLTQLQSDSASEPWCFDDQGGRAANPSLARYKAAYQVAPSAALPSSGAPSRLALVTVSVLGTQGPRTSKVADILKNPDARRVSFLVPDNGR